MRARHSRNANGHASGDHARDGAGAVSSEHGSDHSMPDRYKLVLFNNEILRLDSVSGAVWILDYQRDPQTHEVTRPRWIIVEPATSDDDQ